MDAKIGNWTFNYTKPSDIDAILLKGKMYQLGVGGVVIYPLIILLCIPGVIGNAIVIRVLHFQIKRTPFTIYILNLAVADSGTLIFLFICVILHITTGDSRIEIIECLVCTFCTGQFLLTVISVDRCLAIFFPIWHRCHQPAYLSTILCAITWMVSILICTIHYALVLVKGRKTFRQFHHIFIYTTVWFPLVVVSSLALFIKGFLRSQMKRRGKLLRAILLTLFFFLFFSFPPILIYLINLISKEKYFSLFTYSYLCVCLNSSVNPLIYFLLGRKKEHHSTYNLKITLQRVFKEEEENEEQPEVQVDVHL